MNKTTRLFCFSFVFLLFAACNNQSSQDGFQPKRQVLGIFGGMGPAATADQYRMVVEHTPAEKDQEHIPTVIYSLPQTPDRTASIESGDTSILAYLREGICLLESAGACCIAMPCNTVHYYYDYIEQQATVPVLHMIRETALEIQSKYPDIDTVGILGTTATLNMRLYQDELEGLGFVTVIPDEDITKDLVMKAIYGIKAKTDPKANEDRLTEAGLHVIEKGAGLIVLGCTEIPLGFNVDRVDVPVVNAAQVLAERSIEMYFTR